MTIQGIIKNAAILLGIADDGQEEFPARERLLAALDSALAEIARAFPIQARCRIHIENGTADLPPTVLTPRGLYRDGKRVPLELSDGKIAGEDGSYSLVYYRVPPLASEMEEQAILPFPEDLLRALPFYCAALYVIGEDAALYRQLMEQYNTKLSAALGYRPVAGVEGGGSL